MCQAGGWPRPLGLEGIEAPPGGSRRRAGAATVMTDRRRAAARRVREIASKLGREETSRAIARVTGQRADLAQTTAAQAAAVLRNGRRPADHLAVAIDSRARNLLSFVSRC
jgi:hypothetical protein